MLPDSSTPIAAYDVGHIAAYIQQLLDTDPVLTDLWVAGEITNLSRSQAGHLYFTLADNDGALRCAFFRRENLGTTVEQGDRVLVHGRVSLYVDRGEVQLYVDALQPQGVGLLFAEFQRLAAQLQAEGLFETDRKRPLPSYPRTVGVVTSPAGAVWHDIQNVMARRWPLTRLVLSPCRVQGDGAANTIVAGIRRLNAAAGHAIPDLDLIIVARGGGSSEDLWEFNSEAVARTIFASTLPVVSAVGHETDTTIADMVADVRAPTPSAAAEIIAPDQAEERARIRSLRADLGRALERGTERARQTLIDLIDTLEQYQPNIDVERIRVDDLLRTAEQIVQAQLGFNRTGLATLRGQLAGLDPAATLARGYAIVEDADQRPLTSVHTLQQGDTVGLRFHDGTAAASISTIPHAAPDARQRRR